MSEKARPDPETDYLCHPLRGLLVGAPRGILVHLLPGDRRKQFPELGRQGILRLVVVLAPLQRRQGRGRDRVGQMDLADGRHKSDDFDPVRPFEVVLGNRASSHPT